MEVAQGFAGLLELEPEPSDEPMVRDGGIELEQFFGSPFAEVVIFGEEEACAGIIGIDGAGEKDREGVGTDDKARPSRHEEGAHPVALLGGEAFGVGLDAEALKDAGVAACEASEMACSLFESSALFGALEEIAASGEELIQGFFEMLEAQEAEQTVTFDAL